MTVLPGLIDCHTHLADGVHDPEPVNRARKLPAQIALESVPNARAMLESGFTTVRDVGAYRALGDIALRDAINRGDILGPRMFVAGAYVTITGGAGAMTGLAPDITLPWDLHYGEADSPWEVRRVVRQLAHDGVDHIKVLSSGAVLTHGSNPKSQEFTPEELARRSGRGQSLRPARRGARAFSRRHQECDSRRRGLGRARHPDRRRRHRPRQAARHLPRHGYLRRGVHSGRGQSRKHAARFSRTRCRAWARRSATISAKPSPPE